MPAAHVAIVDHVIADGPGRHKRIARHHRYSVVPAAMLIIDMRGTIDVRSIDDGVVDGVGDGRASVDAYREAVARAARVRVNFGDDSDALADVQARAHRRADDYLAVGRGGNVEGVQAGRVTEVNGVKIVGHTNVAGRLAASASGLYAKNLLTFLEILIDKKEKKLAVNWDDEIVKSTALTRDGAVVHPNFMPKSAA